TSLIAPSAALARPLGPRYFSRAASRASGVAAPSREAVASASSELRYATSIGIGGGMIASLLECGSLLPLWTAGLAPPPVPRQSGGKPPHSKWLYSPR